MPENFFNALQNRKSRLRWQPQAPGNISAGRWKETDFFPFFDKIYTTSEIGESKHSPRRVYLTAAEALGTKLSRTLVVEDSLYALQTAGNAGFLTAGIYDALGEPDQEQLKKDAYIYCRDLTELQNHIFTENGGKPKMKTALTIAGSDSSGGAGIQADIKTMMANGVYAMSAITALDRPEHHRCHSHPECNRRVPGSGPDCIFTDIFPDAVKIGMVSESNLIHMIAGKSDSIGQKKISWWTRLWLSNKGARRLISEGGGDVLEGRTALLQIFTFNIPETEVLTGLERSKAPMDMIKAAKQA